MTFGDPRLPARFWSKVVVDATGCWLWAANTSMGYGQIIHDGRQVGAHRVAYEVLVGPIPEGLHIDHLCRVRHCVNPGHLEPVTQKENNRRALLHVAAKTHCKRGHEFTPENTRRSRTRPRTRMCIACLNRNSKKYADKMRAQRAPGMER